MTTTTELLKSLTEELGEEQARKEGVRIILDMVNKGLVPIEKIIEYNNKVIVKLNL